MQALEISAALDRFERRGAGTDAERRAAGWLAEQLERAGREPGVETFWCRPNWALAHAWHAALALAGSLVSVPSPRVGGALLLAALACILLDELTGVSPGRWLTPERASQNVVVSNPDGGAPGSHRLRLIVTTSYDVPRVGLVHRGYARGPLARLGGMGLGWLGWVGVAIVWLEVIAILRLRGNHGHLISIAQLPPTIGIVLVLAALLELSTADWSGDPAHATSAGVALALFRVLGTTPYRHLDVELVLAGAGCGGGIGLRRYLRRRRGSLSRAGTAVLGVGPCADGPVRWWRSDGPFVPLRYNARLRRLAGRIAADPDSPEAGAHDGRGRTPALPARLARVPAIAIGCLEDHRPPGGESPSSPADDALQFCLMLVDAIETELAAARSGSQLTAPR